MQAIIKRIKSKYVTKHWSASRRLIVISLLFVASQGIISIQIENMLSSRMIREYLQSTMQKEINSPMSTIESRLDQMPASDTLNCCNRAKYRWLLEDIEIKGERIFLIAGEAGYEAIKGSLYLYQADTLMSYADKVRRTEEKFLISSTSNSRPVAVSATKISGGIQTGYLIYIRPIYNIKLIQHLEFLRIASTITSLLLLSIGLGVSLFIILKPLRGIRSDLAEIKWNQLAKARLPSKNYPKEVAPLISEFNRMIKRLYKSSENQKQFASTISHEFRTPLTVISGFIQSVLNRSQGLTQGEKNSLEIANKEVARINRMLSDLLDLSRSENNQLKIRYEPFSIKESIECAIQICQKAFPQQIVILEVPPQSLQALGDIDRFTQCLSNLIENAAKYSPKEQPIKISIKITKKLIQVDVIDEGPGIAKSQLKKIFKSFTRAEGVKLPKGETSSGLGLAIVKMLMTAMHGLVGVESEEGQGSIFTLTIKKAE